MKDRLYIIYQPVLLIFAIGLATFACKQNPEIEIIPKDTMVKILADINIMQAAYAETHDIKKDSVSREYELQLEKIYGYPAETIRQNIALLHTQNERYDSIYERIIDYIDTLQKTTPLQAPVDSNAPINKELKNEIQNPGSR